MGDELPQLWSISKGDVSFVDPRPTLFNQDDLVALRTQYGVDKVQPGLTGWAQINGRDELPIPDKVKLDVDYPRNGSWTGASVRFSGFLARRDDDADCILLGGATKPGSRKNVQSRL